MKTSIYLAFVLGLFISCSNEKTKSNNPYIPNYSFSYVININLASYAALNSAINPILITDPSGITMIVMKVSDTDYRAWNSYCPNQSPVDCSKMSINGVNAKCSCENLEYSLFTGSPTTSVEYGMISYSVQILGNNSIRVYN